MSWPFSPSFISFLHRLRSTCSPHPRRVVNMSLSTSAGIWFTFVGLLGAVIKYSAQTKRIRDEYYLPRAHTELEDIFAPWPISHFNLSFCLLIFFFFPSVAGPSRRINSVSELNFHKFTKLLAKRFYVTCSLRPEPWSMFKCLHQLMRASRSFLSIKAAKVYEC